MFEGILANIKYETIRFLSHIQIASDDDMRKLEEQRRKEQEGREYQHAQSASLAQQDNQSSDDGAQAVQPIQRVGPKVGRNDPCPCGSGKKYKQCHGKI